MVRYGFRNEQEELFPLMVVMEITNVCNLKCIHCPYVFISRQPGYKPKHMAWDVYKKISDEVSRYKNTIFRFTCDGEPMCHPRFLDMIRYAKKRKISPVCFNTNGFFLDTPAAREILECGVEIVEVSLDALSEDTYTKIRRGSDFSRVINNLNRFIELRDTMNSGTKIMVSIIDQPKASGELRDFIDYWTPRVDRVITRAYTSVGGLVDRDKLKDTDCKQRWPCPHLWRRVFINVDGLAEFCVDDWYDETIIGDIKNSSIKEIWASKQYRQLRRLHTLQEFNQIPYCKDCSDWEARGWDYDYFYALNKVLGVKQPIAGIKI